MNDHPYINLHTHHLQQADDEVTVYNLLLGEANEIPDQHFSAGLHPWHADRMQAKDVADLLIQSATSPRLVAFGETGLDKSCKVPMQVQVELFDLHLQTAMALKKPLILHCVKAWDELIKISSHYQIVKILHGYNGSVELTRRLLQEGFMFSIGKMILNPSASIQTSIGLIPLEHLFCETDTADFGIREIYRGVAAAIGGQEEKLKVQIFQNFVRLTEAATS